MFIRDAILWKLTMKYPGNRARRDILRRIFSILRYGGLFYRNDKKSNEYNFRHDLNLPIGIIYLKMKLQL
jgi:hypothetical protein